MSTQKYVCNVCDWVYDPERGAPQKGVAPGTVFEWRGDSDQKNGL